MQQTFKAKVINLIQKKSEAHNASDEQRWSREHKAQNQGQEHKKNPRPRTALTRTEPLKAKDQGHKCKCSPEKKSFLKNFFRHSPK